MSKEDAEWDKRRHEIVLCLTRLRGDMLTAMDELDRVLDHCLAQLGEDRHVARECASFRLCVNRVRGESRLDCTACGDNPEEGID